MSDELCRLLKEEEEEDRQIVSFGDSVYRAYTGPFSYLKHANS